MRSTSLSKLAGATMALALGIVITFQLFVSMHHCGLPIHPINGPSSSFFTTGRATTSATSTTSTSASILPLRRYFEVGAEIQDKLTLMSPSGKRFMKQAASSSSAFNLATQVQHAPWFPKAWYRQLCRKASGCCVEMVATSLTQDQHKIVNTGDGKDVADLLLEFDRRHQSPTNFLQYHATSLHPEMMSCLVPGTVIFLENIDKNILYFWKVLRPQIKVPYALILSGTDNDTPGLVSQQYLKDPLLLKLFGTNPKFDNSDNDNNDLHKTKYQAIPTGLSRWIPQEKYLTEYLALNQYQNPFSSKWKQQLVNDLHSFNFDEHVFVHFGRRVYQRQRIWAVLCGNTTTAATANNNHNNTSTGSLSCHDETTKSKVHDIYSSMTLGNYKFGISPPGKGWDCYRTYEFLLLGIIPIIDNTGGHSTADMLEGLPYLHMPMFHDQHQRNPKDKEHYMEAIQHYLQSDSFRNANFEEGWKKLFLQYTRRQVLAATQRDREIIRDDQGNEYYMAYKYSLMGKKKKDIYCTDEDSCLLPAEEEREDLAWMHTTQKQPAWTAKEKTFYSTIENRWKGNNNQASE